MLQVPVFCTESVTSGRNSAIVQETERYTIVIPARKPKQHVMNLYTEYHHPPISDRTYLYFSITF